MAGHPLLHQVRTKSEPLIVDGNTYQVIVTYNQVIGIDGYVVGLKFADKSGSMDAAKAVNTNAMHLANAVGHRAVQMIKPDLLTITVLGFYLLTADLDARSQFGRRGKMRLYRAQAAVMKKELVEKLQHLTEFEVVDGAAWVISEKPYHTYAQFNLLEKELAKQMRVTLC